MWKMILTLVYEKTSLPLEMDSEVGAGFFGFQKINRTRQEIGSKSAVAVFSRVLASARTLELDLREDLTKKYWSDVM